MFSNIADGKLSWTVNKPIVYIDAEELIKKEATKAIVKEVNKFLKGFFKTTVDSHHRVSDKIALLCLRLLIY